MKNHLINSYHVEDINHWEEKFFGVGRNEGTLKHNTYMQAELFQEKNKCNILLWSQFFQLILWRNTNSGKRTVSSRRSSLVISSKKKLNAILHGKSELHCALYFCLATQFIFHVFNWNSRASLQTERVHVLYKHFSGCSLLC